MEKVSVALMVPKESKEVIDLLAMVLEKVKAKAELAEYAALIGALSVAVDGVSGIKEELKSDGLDEVAAYLVHKVMGALLVKESV
jgi:hypothetical protein